MVPSGKSLTSPSAITTHSADNTSIFWTWTVCGSPRIRLGDADLVHSSWCCSKCRVFCRFDTYRSKNESQRLAQYVDLVQEGLILAMVVNDEGSNNLEDSAKKALAALGSQHFRSLGFRWESVCTWKTNNIHFHFGIISIQISGLTVQNSKITFLMFWFMRPMHLEWNPFIRLTIAGFFCHRRYSHL